MLRDRPLSNGRGRHRGLKVTHPFASRVSRWLNRPLDQVQHLFTSANLRGEHELQDRSDESMTGLNPGLTGLLPQRVMACLEPLRSVEKAGVEPTA